MSTTLMTEPAAGWYHDPADAGAWRWWDGATWTDHIRSKDEAGLPAQTGPAVIVEPVPTHAPVFTIVEPQPESAPAVAPEPAAVAAPAAAAPAPAGPAPTSSIPQPGQVAAGPAVGRAVQSTFETPVTDQMYWHSSAAEVIDVPRLSHPTTGSIATQRGRAPSFVRDWQDLGSPDTAGIWLLALSPILYIAVSVLIGFIDGFTGGVFGRLGPLVIAGITVGLCWIFAYADQRSLAQRGYHAPAVWWMLLIPPLAYFIARGKAVRRESMRAWPPELLFFLLVGGAAALSLLLSAALAAALGCAC